MLSTWLNYRVQIKIKGTGFIERRIPTWKSAQATLPSNKLPKELPPAHEMKDAVVRAFQVTAQVYLSLLVSANCVHVACMEWIWYVWCNSTTLQIINATLQSATLSEMTNITPLENMVRLFLIGGLSLAHFPTLRRKQYELKGSNRIHHLGRLGHNAAHGTNRRILACARMGRYKTFF